MFLNNMKKGLIITGIVLLCIVVLSLICYLCYQNDQIRFKVSYEYLNQVEDSNGEIVKVKVPFKNGAKYVNGKELLEVLEKGTGVVYFGYNTCPWCRLVVPVLVDACKESGLKEFYYVDLKHSFKDYSEQIYKHLDGNYKVENGEKYIASPTVYFVKNGKVKANYIGSNGIIEYPYGKVSKEKKNELKELYMDAIKLIK